MRHQGAVPQRLLKIEANRAYFGDFDPFGDFDLLFGAAKLNLKIAEVPVRYRERMYGTTKISRFSTGCFCSACRGSPSRS